MDISGEIFEKDEKGRVVRLRSWVTLFPGRQNGFKMLFGGEVLKTVDELSGNLATAFVATPGLQAVHTSEDVHFYKPLQGSEAGLVIASVVLATEKIVCVHIAVVGGDAQDPSAFSLRYRGFGLCAILAGEGTMVNWLTPYEGNPALVPTARKVVEFHREIRKELKDLPLY